MPMIYFIWYRNLKEDFMNNMMTINLKTQMKCTNSFKIFNLTNTNGTS